MTRAATIVADLIADHGYSVACWLLAGTNLVIAAALLTDSFK